MWGPGGLSCFIRFVCHIPTGFVGPSTLAKYVQATGLGDIYDVIPHGRAFLRGMGIVGVVGTVTFVWNFFQFMASPLCRGYLLGLIGVLDLILAVLLIPGVAMQSKFLPGTYGGCNGASNWNNATDGRNFFVAANATGSFDADGPDSVCHGIMQNWVLAIVVIIFYLICGIANVLIGFHYSERGTYRSWGSFSQYDVDQVPKLFHRLGFLAAGPYRVYELLARSVHISRRYMSKYRDRNTDPIRPAIKVPEQAMTEMPPSNSAHLQLPREVVIKITKNLHSIDLLNLSRSSKHLRTIFFGNDNPQQALNELRQFACKQQDSPPAHWQCAVCSIRICKGCRHKVHVPSSQALDHLTNCRPACSKCFFRNYCGRKARTGERNSGKKGHVRGWFASRHTLSSDLEMQGGSNAELAYQKVCRNCSKMSGQEMLWVMDEHILLELQRQARFPLTCVGCDEVVRVEGVRWWVDTRTGRECRWGGHPGWVKDC